MKKPLLILGLLVTLGAGCTSSTQTNVAANTNVGSTNASATGNQATTSPPASSSASANASGLATLPYTAPTEPLEDDSAWVAFTTRSGITITYPVKGPDAPTWTVTIIAKDDAHLQGNCYLTNETVYKKDDAFDSFEGGGCLTTTSFSAEAGTRTDYYVMGTNLLTFTKVYTAGFDQNLYTAILIKIINTID